MAVGCAGHSGGTEAARSAMKPGSSNAAHLKVLQSFASLKGREEMIVFQRL
jgi:hypothetical protein